MGLLQGNWKLQGFVTLLCCCSALFSCSTAVTNPNEGTLLTRHQGFSLQQLLIVCCCGCVLCFFWFALQKSFSWFSRHDHLLLLHDNFSLMSSLPDLFCKMMCSHCAVGNTTSLQWKSPMVQWHRSMCFCLDRGHVWWEHHCYKLVSFCRLLH